MLAEAVFQVIAADVPIVRPRNVVQFTLQILIVFPSAIKNVVEETMLWPEKYTLRVGTLGISQLPLKLVMIKPVGVI